VQRDGFCALKLKVGSDDPFDGVRRLEAVRRALGPTVRLAIDGNGKWDLPTCLRFVRRAAAFNLFWFEEPLWCADVGSHRALAEQSPIPIALGEQLYSLDAFRAFVATGAWRVARAAERISMSLMLSGKPSGLPQSSGR
jgi:L-alanine-DL-glutamate epimerase-like enolase superfamily enzyme